MKPKQRTVVRRDSRAGSPTSLTSKVGKRGTVVIPSRLRRRFGFEEGSLVIAEEAAEGVLIRPAAAVALEIYSPERRAEFLLSNAVDARDYERVVRLVRRMGLDPVVIPHRKPRPRP
jgi:AbrB family looped-hinge helix DNA binding protein